MELQPGVRLGPYEIVAPIGAGGMGEVYRARDTRLNRIVAIKILPVEFSTDARLRVRFEQEAKTISALNHPNICSLFDVGDSYLVMEYCEGKTLARRIDDGPLPIDQVIDYGVQIAEALAKAHRQSIVHRDLKPSNIMITKSGVKLLDFGLAKHHYDSSAAESTAEALSEDGKILGTVQYMSPEVLQGKAADARSDIFALGAVLYEMVTGRAAFSGDSKASLIASIIFSQPAFINTNDPPLSPALEHVIRRSLEKDPDERWQAAHDIGAELRWIRDDRHAPAEHKPVGHRRVTLGVIGALLLVSLLALVMWRTTDKESPASKAQRFDLQPPENVRIAESTSQSVLAISPDGAWVAFRGLSDDPSRTGLYLRSTLDLEARLIGNATSPFFSPDSKWIGFFADGAIRKLPVNGGEPVRICEATRVRGATWGDDGTIIFGGGNGLVSVSADGGDPEAITSPEPGEGHLWPHFFPGSKKLLFLRHRGFGESHKTIAVMSVEKQTVHDLIPGSYPRYSGNGRLIFSRFGELYMASFDVNRLTVGEAKPVLSDVHTWLASGFAAFDVSRSGSLVYIPGAPRVLQGELVWVDRQGNATPVVAGLKGYGFAAISPAGNQIAVSITETVDNHDLWIYEIDRKLWRRLTVGKVVDGRPTWSPDGKLIVFTSLASGRGKLFSIAADGGGQVEQLTSGVGLEFPGTISPDHQFLVFDSQTKGNWDVLTLRLDGRHSSPNPFAASEFNETGGVLSPDGRWIAFSSNETGRQQVHVQRYPSGQKTVVSAEGGADPLWSRDGNELFYRKGKEIWAVPVFSSGKAFRAPHPKLLFKADFLLERQWLDGVDVAPDGKKFLAIRWETDPQAHRRLMYVPNWTQEMEQTYRTAR